MRSDPVARVSPRPHAAHFMLSALFLSALSCHASAPAPAKAAEPAAAESAALPYRPSTVKTPDGLNIAVQTWGNPKGQTIVFIHGLAQSHLSWTRQTSSGLAGSFRLVTYDLRGHGDSDEPHDPAYYEEGRRWGEELGAVLDSIDAEKPVVVGWSLGGAVIVNYLAAHGDAKLGGVVLVDAVSRMDRSQLPSLPPLTSPDLATRLDASRRFLLACFATPPSGESFETMLAFNAQVPRHVLAATAHISLTGGDAALRALRVPVLVIHGADDALVRVGMSRAAADMIPGARLSVYEGTGHAPFYEQPARFNGELAAFARGIEDPHSSK